MQAETIIRKTGTSTAQNVCLYDAAGNPISLIGGGVPVWSLNGGGGGGGASSNPTDNYCASDVDSQDMVKYYGFLDSSGNWFIRQEDSISGSIRYANGNASYAASWSGRAGLSYFYFDNISWPTGTGSPLVLYSRSDFDENDTVKYYGFLDSTGKWFIRKEDWTLGTTRYVGGSSGGYIAAWSTRATQVYDYFDLVF